MPGVQKVEQDNMVAENHVKEVSKDLAEEGVTSVIKEETESINEAEAKDIMGDDGAKDLAEELDQLKEQIQEIKKDQTKEEGFQCINKAMELPLVSGLTSSVYATTEYISTTRPVSIVSEKMKDVGEREEVKSILTSVTTLYENNMSPRVDELRTVLTPTLKNLDGYACAGIDKVNEKVTETKEGYVDPMVNKISTTKEAYVDTVVEKVADIKEKTSKVVQDCTESGMSMKNSYVDPAIERVNNVKDSYVNPIIEHVTSIKDSYVDPAIVTATNVKDNYVYPAMETVNLVKDNYVAPAISKAYQDPRQAYDEAVVYGKEVISATKDAAMQRASNTIDSAKEYLQNAKDTSVEQVQMYVNGAREAVRISSRKSLDKAITFAKQTRDSAMSRTANLLLQTQSAAYEQLHARYPTVADLIDRGINRITTTTEILFNATKTTVTVTINTTRDVATKVGDGIQWSKESFTATREILLDTKEKALTYGTEFTKANEDNIRHYANIAGLSSYVGFIGLELKEKAL